MACEFEKKVKCLLQYWQEFWKNHCDFCDYVFTVPTIPVWTKPVLCTNWPKITMLFYYLKVPKDFSPLGPTLALTGALKWGTVWTSISNGTGITKDQI